MKLGHIFLGGVALLELCFFISYSIWGRHGLQSMRVLSEKNLVLEREIELVQRDIDKLTDELEDWEAYPFFKERHARQQLQMAQHDDEVFLI